MTQTHALPYPFRPLPIRAMNAVGRALARFDARPIALDEPSLMRAASRANGGLEDFGEPSFRPGLRKLVESLEVDARLNLFGRYFARRQLLELLAQRLVLRDYSNRHPEVAHEAIRRPLFILGLPRTGTTLLHGLLAEDPAHRTPLSWEVDAPCPPAESATYHSDPRIAKTEKRFEQLRQLAPGFQAIHPIGSRMPQECIVLTAPEFMSVRFEMCFDVAGYQTWLQGQDMTHAYRFHRRFLQHMQSRHAAERWVLKSPGHLGPLDALFEVYPDALIVQTHRDPVRVVPSVASLEYTLRMVSSDEVDPVRLGRQQLHLWSALLEQGMEARARHPEREARILDLHMHDIVRDPLACIRRVYERFDLELSPESLQRMRGYLAKHPRNEFGEHRYSLEAFGLEAQAIEHAFKGYRERFGIEAEPYV
jgi:Sulfotransferase family